MLTTERALSKEWLKEWYGEWVDYVLESPGARVLCASTPPSLSLASKPTPP